MNEIQQSSQSEDYLKIDSKGIIGCCERIPVVAKLVAITAAGSLVIIAFSIWLIVLNSLSLVSAVQTKTYADAYYSASSLVASLQLERTQMVIWATPSDETWAAYKNSMLVTDKELSIFDSFTYWENPTELSQEKLALVREAVGIQDPMSIFFRYGAILDAVLSLISDKTKRVPTSSFTQSHLIFIQYRETRGILRGLAILSFSNTNHSKNSDYYHYYEIAYNQRDKMHKLFMNMASDSIISFINTNFYSTSEYQVNAKMEYDALNAPIELFCNSSNVKLYASISAILASYLQLVFEKIQSELSTTTAQSYTIAMISVFLIIFLSLVAMLVFACLSFLLSQSIVRPWVRMNKLQ